jgi:hypothetical protein
MKRLGVLSALLACWLAAGLAALAVPAGADGTKLHRRVDPAMQCDHCHSTASWQFDFERVAGTRFEHGWTGFPLRGRHAVTACLECHANDLQPGRACRNCHDDQHEGRLGQDCDRCHSADGWNEVSPFIAHRNARLPLSGMHALIECNACHTQTTVGRADTPPSECFACHQRDYELHTNHPRHLADPSDPARAPFPKDCRQCHSTLAWSPARLPRELASFEPARVGGLTRAITRREHERHLPIALGAHAASECSDCHTGASPSAVTCVGCHAHAEPALRRQHASVALPASRSGALCLSCHVRGARR